MGKLRYRACTREIDRNQEDKTLYAYIKGTLEEITEDNIVVEAGGIGYNVNVSANTAGLLPSLGDEIKIYTYTLVREDTFSLYGFLTRDDLNVFKQLITVNGIGPKGGLAILSVMSADDLRLAIVSGDAKMIARAPGIGKKTAERVILDLRDKISMEDVLSGGIDGGMKEAAPSGASHGSGADNAVRKEAIEALTALGYSLSDATAAVRKVEITEDTTVEDVLKLALKNIF
jgi:Holliday junction DNA helicase RuvA